MTTFQEKGPAPPEPGHLADGPTTPDSCPGLEPGFTLPGWTIVHSCRLGSTQPRIRTCDPVLSVALSEALGKDSIATAEGTELGELAGSDAPHGFATATATRTIRAMAIAILRCSRPPWTGWTSVGPCTGTC